MKVWAAERKHKIEVFLEYGPSVVLPVAVPFRALTPFQSAVMAAGSTSK